MFAFQMLYQFELTLATGADTLSLLHTVLHYPANSELWCLVIITFDSINGEKNS